MSGSGWEDICGAALSTATVAAGSPRSNPLTTDFRFDRPDGHRKRWPRLTVEVKNRHLIGLRMYRQDFVDTLLTSIGLPDVRIGDETVNRRFIIQTRDVETTKQLLQDATLRDDLIRADVDTVEMYGTKLHGYYAREEKDPAHAELLFNAMTHLADAIDTLKWDYKPEILYPSPPR
jgi:hypothetical protein